MDVSEEPGRNPIPNREWRGTRTLMFRWENSAI